MTCDENAGRAKRLATTATASCPVAGHRRRRQQRAQLAVEFRILKSIIPNVADRKDISELEIIDACVNYIECLQSQLLRFGLASALPVASSSASASASATSSASSAAKRLMALCARRKAFQEIRTLR